MKKIQTIILLLAVAVFTACSSIDCDLQGKVQCHYAFVNSDDGFVQLTSPLSVTLIRKSTDTDSVFINHLQNASVFDVPMSYVSQTDTMMLTVSLTDSTSISDIIMLTKTNEPTFEDVDCPARYRHEIQSVSSTHNFIDTLIINNPKVSNDASVQNIFIRMRTD